MKKWLGKMKEKTSLFLRVSLALFFFALILHLIFRLFPPFADFFNLRVSSWIRAFFSYLTYLLPFSLAETVVLFMPFAVFLIVFIPSCMIFSSGKKADALRKTAAQKRAAEEAVRAYREENGRGEPADASPRGDLITTDRTSAPGSTASPEEVFLPEEIEADGIEKKADKRLAFILGNLFGVVLLFYSTFVLSFSAGYLGSTLDKKLSLDRRQVANMELYTTARKLLEEIDPLLDDISFAKGGASQMPYTRDELNSLLNGAYEKAAVKYDYLPVLRSKLKYISLSDLMTYTHISGIYSYYTGEANVNINYPDYTLPFTAAHEMAHQRGVSREDEASFTAFLVCMESDDPYIRYSACLSVFDYVSSALYSADLSLYRSIYASLDRRVLLEEIAFSEFFDKYRDSTASKVSNTVNDTYLKLQGQTEGTRSYDLVVDLAVAYFRGDEGTDDR